MSNAEETGRWQDDARLEKKPLQVAGSLDDALARIEKLAQEGKERRNRVELWAAAQTQTITCDKHPNRILRIDLDECSRRSARESERIGEEAFVLAYEDCPECKLEKQIRRESHWLTLSGVPDNLLHGSFATFRAERAEDTDNLAGARAFVDKARGFLIMTGNVGDGKSLLAVAVLRELMGGRFVTHNNLLLELRRGYGDRNAQDVILKCQKTRCLVLDDFGLSMGDADELPMLQSVLDHRYGNRLPTVITSNLTLTAIKDFMGARLSDRIDQAMFRHLTFSGPSSRKAERSSYFA